MYYLVGKDNCVRTLVALCAAGGQPPQNLQELRTSYARFISSVAGAEYTFDPNEPQETHDPNRVQNLLKPFVQRSVLCDFDTDVMDTPLTASLEAMQRVSEGKDYIQYQDQGLRELFDLTIHTTFYYRSASSGGGSASAAPGVIWCGPRRFWTPSDAAEFLVHELAHNLLFLDERRFGHYKNHADLLDENTHAISSILRKKRPLDKAFHSLIVAYDVLGFRQKAGCSSAPIVHPPTERLFQDVQTTLQGIIEVIAKHDIVTNRFRFLVDSVSVGLDSMKFKALEAA